MVDAREAFERWYVGALVTQGAREIERNANGDYILMQTRLAWQAWHAGWLERMPELGTDEPEVGTAGVPVSQPTPAEVERCRLLDELIQSWRDKGDAPEQRERRIRARAAVEAAWPCGVALPELTEREQTLAGLLKRCARCLPPEHATRKLATDYLKQQGFINPLRGTAGVGEGLKR